jgi:hypothetical protein
MKEFFLKYWLPLLTGLLAVLFLTWIAFASQDMGRSDSTRVADFTSQKEELDEANESGKNDEQVNESVVSEEKSVDSATSSSGGSAVTPTSETTSSSSAAETTPETSPEPTPEPEPEPEPESPSAFLAFYADNQSDSDDDDARHQNVVNRILASGANPVIHAGDLMEDGTQNSFDRFLNVAGILLGSRTFYGALGNNDRLFGDSATPSPIFLDYFNFPNNEKWYSVNSGNLHLVILDSAFSASDPAQISWLASDLQSAASQSRITAVIFHHPTCKVPFF